MPALVKIIIAHPMPVYCDGFIENFRKTTGVAVVEEAHNAEMVLDHLKQGGKQMLFLFDEIEINESELLLSTIKKEYPDVLIILLTYNKKVSYIQRALHNGIKGVIRVNVKDAILKEAFKTVFEGGVSLCRETSDILAGKATGGMNNETSPEKIFTYCEKLLECFKLLVRGFTLEEIMEEMDITYSTVKKHSSQIGKKLRKAGYKNVLDYCDKTGYH